MSVPGMRYPTDRFAPWMSLTNHLPPCFSTVSS